MIANNRDEKQEALLMLPPKKIRTILEELRTLRNLANAGEDVEVPMVTLHLKSGRNMIGWLLGIDEERNEQYLLFQLAGERWVPCYDIAYLDTDSIEALTVHNAADIAHLLSFGRISAPPGKPAPTRLDLKRKAEHLAEIVSKSLGEQVTFSFDWNGIPETSEAMLTLVRIISETSGALVEIAKDDLGKETLAKSLRKIVFTYSVEPGVDFKEDTLTVAVDLSGMFGETLNRDSLRAMIEDLF